MSIRPLIFKDGVYTIPRSSTDTNSLLATLGLNLVNNTSDLNKPISIAQQAALDLKANLVSPNLIGTPTVPTATAGTNTIQVANCAFVYTAISNLVASSPAALDTLNELATALGNDANFSSTVTNSLANKVDLTTNQSIGGIKTFSGSLLLPSTSGTSIGTVWRNVDNLEYKDSDNVTKIILNSAGNLSNLANKQTALNNLVGTQTTNRLLRSDGTNVTLSQVNLTTDVTNTLPVSSGGTGSNTQNFVDLSSAQTVAGSKTFTSSMTLRGDVGIMNLFGNSDTYNTFRFTGNTNTANSYWDMGVMPSVLNRDFYIGSGWSGSGQIALKLSATTGSMSVLGTITTTSNAQSTSTTTGSVIANGGIGALGNIYGGGGLNLANLPTSSAGLPAGSFWRNGNIVNIV